MGSSGQAEPSATRGGSSSSSVISGTGPVCPSPAPRVSFMSSALRPAGLSASASSSSQPFIHRPIVHGPVIHGHSDVDLLFSVLLCNSDMTVA